jgi:hypothetical protein
MNVYIVAILFGFASLAAFFAFVLAYQQRQTESDCCLEDKAGPSSHGTWWLCYLFFGLALLSALAGLKAAF